MKRIVPAISSGTVGPLGACHLPRMWLKILLHATGRLPEGYRHGTGGADESTMKNLGIDRDACIAFVESTLPTYLEFETWVRENARNLSPEAIAQHNAVRVRDKTEELAAAQRAYIGIDAPTLRQSTVLNDLDDWATLHALITRGTIPPLVGSSLNAEFCELLKPLVDESRARTAAMYLEMPELGWTASGEAAAVVRCGNPVPDGSLSLNREIAVEGAVIGRIEIEGAEPAWRSRGAAALDRATARAAEAIAIVRAGRAAPV